MTTNLALMIIETDGVEFYTDITTGKSGISQTGLATLCGVSRQAVSKLINSLSTGSAPESLKALQEHLEENTWRTKSGMVIQSESIVLELCRYYYQRGSCTDEACELIGMPPIRKASSKKGPEKIVQERMKRRTGGEIEVLTESGKIDLLTSTELIEIKEVKSWKAGIGQILVYAHYYPSHSKRLHLFGACHSSYLENIRKHCHRFDITLTWES